MEGLAKEVHNGLQFIPIQTSYALGVRPNLQRLNMLSERAEVISVWPAVPCSKWKRKIHRLEKSFSPRRVPRQATFINVRDVTDKGAHAVSTA